MTSTSARILAYFFSSLFDLVVPCVSSSCEIVAKSCSDRSMSPTYASKYTKLPGGNDRILEDDKNPADGSRERFLSDSPDPSLSRNKNPSRGDSRPAFSRSRPSSSKPKFIIKDFRNSEYGEPTTATVHYFGPEPSPRPWSAAAIVSHSISGYLLWIFASLRAITAILQLSLLLFLQISYLKLPQTATGQLPHLNNLYATYPFISCVGSLHLITYRTLTAVSVTLSITTDSILFYRARHEPIGYYFRRINILSSFLAATLLLYLSYAAKDSETTLHLFLIGMHSLAVLAVKASNLAKDHATRQAYPALRSDPIAHTIRWWKEATVWFALPMAILLNMGTYACRNDSPAVKQTPGTACYRVLAIAAPADWFYALITVNWSLHMGFEISQDGHLSMVVARSRAMVMGMYRKSESEDGAEYEALASGKSLRGTLWDADHPNIDLDDVPAAVVKEIA
jgi:hypothetical protein